MKFGIIGASFARAAYLPALKHVPGAEAVALASERIESARSAADAFGIPNAYDDWRQMLDTHKLDVVLIATPTDTHLPMTLAALEHGAHVVCEKPTAMNAGEAQTMLERAKAAGRLHMDHKQASLEELGSLAEPPLTKDAVAGRIRRLLAMTDKRASDLGLPGTEASLTDEMVG